MARYMEYIIEADKAMLVDALPRVKQIFQKLDSSEVFLGTDRYDITIYAQGYVAGVDGMGFSIDMSFTINPSKAACTVDVIFHSYVEVTGPKNSRSDSFQVDEGIFKKNLAFDMGKFQTVDIEKAILQGFKDTISAIKRRYRGALTNTKLADRSSQ